MKIIITANIFLFLLLNSTFSQDVEIWNKSQTTQLDTVFLNIDTLDKDMSSFTIDFIVWNKTDKTLIYNVKRQHICRSNTSISESFCDFQTCFIPDNKVSTWESPTYNVRASSVSHSTAIKFSNLKMIPDFKNIYSYKVFDDSNVNSLAELVIVLGAGNRENCETTAVNNKIDLGKTIKLSPTITNREINIDIPNQMKVQRLIISNLGGQVMYENDAQFNNKIDVSSLPSGFYYLSLFVNNKIVTKKFIVEH